MGGHRTLKSTKNSLKYMKNTTISKTPLFRENPIITHKHTHILPKISWVAIEPLNQLNPPSYVIDNTGVYLLGNLYKYLKFILLLGLEFIF